MRTYFVSNHGLSLIYNCHLGSHFILTKCWIHFNYYVNCYEFVLLCPMFYPPFDLLFFLCLSFPPGGDVIGPMLIAKLSKRCASAMLFNRTKSNGNETQFLIPLKVGMT